MAFAVVDKFRRRYFNATMADISAASSVYIAMPCRGRVVRAYVTLDAAITGADSALTSSINSTAITGMTGTATNSGSAAGSVYTLADATAARDFVDGDVIKLTSDGASSTTSVAQWTLVVDTY